MSPDSQLIDSHCHLQYLETAEQERALDAARGRGVRGFLVPATKLEEAENILDLCRRHADVWCALGVHPHEASGWKEGDGRRLAALLTEPEVVAVGECGLDFFYDHSPREAQIRVVEEQWELALDLGLPVVVHNRESDEELLKLARKVKFGELRGDFHSFSGELRTAEELLEMGFFIGTSGMITFRKAENIRAILAATPEDRLLVETDTPFLAPVPHRGRTNEPAFVVEVGERVAAERSTTLERIAQITTANFRRLFDRVGGVESA